MKWLHMVSFILIIVGALNWGLVGLGSFVGSDLNLVHLILGSVPMLESLVYLVVGLAGVYEVVTHKANCKMCASSVPMM